MYHTPHPPSILAPAPAGAGPIIQDATGTTGLTASQFQAIYQATQGAPVHTMAQPGGSRAQQPGTTHPADLTHPHPPVAIGHAPAASSAAPPSSVATLTVWSRGPSGAWSPVGNYPQGVALQTVASYANAGQMAQALPMGQHP